jgi:hypothetical protein
MANLSKLHVEVTASTSAFARAMDKNSKRVKAFRERVGRAKVALAGMATTAAATALALGGLAVLSKKMFDLGASIMETGSKFNTVFGAKASKEVAEFLDTFAHKAGLTITEAKGLVATTGAIAQGMGFSQSASAKFATEITKTAADLSSFNNMPTEEVLMAVNSALTGEREQMKRLGIVIKETDVQQLALANSGKTVAKALTQQEKATATLELITSKAGVAMGDLDRTMESPANRAKMMAANIRELRDSIAIALMPVFSKLLDKMAEGSGGFDELNRKIKGSSLKILAVVELLNATLMALWNTLLKFPAKVLKNSFEIMIGFIVTLKNAIERDAVGIGVAVANLQRNFQELFDGLNAPAVGVINFMDKWKALKEVINEDLTSGIANAADAVATKLNPNLGDLGKTIETLDEKLRKLTENFTKNFVDRMVKTVSESKNAFAGFFAYMQMELTKLIARFLAFKALTAMFPHSEFIAGVTGTPATVAGAGGGGGVTPGSLQKVVPTLPAGMGITPSVSGGGGGMTVIQNITIPVQAIDGQDASRFLTENKGTIAKVISEATRDSTGFRHQLLSGTT